jgi:hypothetical protein
LVLKAVYEKKVVKGKFLALGAMFTIASANQKFKVFLKLTLRRDKRMLMII